MNYERITTEDVQVGDRIARTRGEAFPKVTRIDEGPVSRRLHLQYVEGDLPPWVAKYESADGTQFHAGNIRPRRTAKLWRLVENQEEA